MLTVERLYSGIFECTECEIEYSFDRATKEDLFCEQCGADVHEIEDDPDEDIDEVDAENDDEG
jgi:transcription initiation factor IIE alpha subunit